MNRLFLLGGKWVVSSILISLSAISVRPAAAEWVPDLPETPFNYANVTLPQHFLVNGFPANQRQNAVIDNDNTPADNAISDAGATLGRVLFYERKLSANETTSCSSCHQQSQAFSDGDRFSMGFQGGETRRHSMGLANARFYESGKFFWDERAATLEDQVLMPIQDPVEMGLTLEELVQVVESQSYYGPLFEAAFGDAEVTTDRISKALAQFVRSILSFDSKYDQGRALVDSPLAPFPNFTRQENQGKNLFMRPVPGTVASCVSCHMSEAFITPARFNAPPNLTSDATNNGLQSLSTNDFGVMESTENPADDFKFKVPSLRNIAVRPPYMHDGRFNSLQQVIGFYSNGIQNHPNLSNVLRGPNETVVRFNFNAGQRADMLAFLETLTDETMLVDPKFSDPFVFVETVPVVEQVLVNSGDVERSIVTEILVLFDTEVDLGDEAFTLVDRRTGESVDALEVTHLVSEGKSTCMINFIEHSAVRLRPAGNALQDGNYHLMISSEHVTAVEGSAAMEEDFVYGDSAEEAVFALFGDLDGDRDVDGLDIGAFGNAFLKVDGDPGFQYSCDYDGDGDVDGLDLGAFGQAFLTTLPFE